MKRFIRSPVATKNQCRENHMKQGVFTQPGSFASVRVCSLRRHCGHETRSRWATSSQRRPDKYRLHLVAAITTLSYDELRTLARLIVDDSLSELHARSVRATSLIREITTGSRCRP